MNDPRFPDDPETRITAFLLGELDAAEAAQVRAAMAQDPELARMHDRLAATISVVRQALTTATPHELGSSPDPDLPRLSAERRRSLLRRFETVPLPHAAGREPSGRRRRVPWQVTMALAAVLVALLAVSTLVLPHYWTPRRFPMSSLLSVPSASRVDKSEREGHSAEPSVAGADYDNGRSDLSSSSFRTLRETDADRQPMTNASGVARLARRGESLGEAYFYLPPTADALAVAVPPLVSSDRESAGVPLLGDAPFVGESLAKLTTRYGLAKVEQLAEQPADRMMRGLEDRGRTVELGVTELAPGSGPVVVSAPSPRPRPAEGRTEQGLEGSVGFGLWGRSPAPSQPLSRGSFVGQELELGRRDAFDRSSGELVPLDIKLPIPAFMGTPTDLPFAIPLDRITELSSLADGVVSVDEGASPTAGRELERVGTSKTPVTEEAGKPLVAGGSYVDTYNLDFAPVRLAAPAGPLPEVDTAEDAFSTFSLNVTDVSFKLAAASLERGQMPEAAAVRSEEFINAFDYHDPEPAPGRRVALAWERARYPFAHQRDLLRLSVKTAARGREPARSLNLVLCLDSSGSMERADRVQIVREALAVLAGQLQPLDRVSVVAFARTARLWVDAMPGSQAGELIQRVGELAPEGGTNLEEALRLAYATAARHHEPGSASRVVLLTDGAANLGEVDPESLKELVIAQRRQGIALDCFGVGWEGYHDDLLETISRNGDGRYGFLNTPEEAVAGFADQLAGAFQVAASDVKVQVEFNPGRVRHHRLVGYTKHQLTQEQFRDNTVDAAELGAAESGNALYVIETDPAGTGPVAVARVRFKVAGTDLYEEMEWTIPFEGPAVALERASPALRLAATAAAFAEWLGSSPYAAEVSPAVLLGLLRGVPEVYALDPRPGQLEWMIRQAGSMSGR